MYQFNKPLPLSLYIHIPWCIRKCPYCDFNSHTLKQELPEKKYIEQLITDLEQDLPKIENRILKSIFIGGGTPSLFSPGSIQLLIKEIQKRIPFEPIVEITLEANPGMADYNRFCGFYEAGVNRLSIGVQSFQNTKLKQLGRVHDQTAAIHAAEAAHAAGFKTFNLDLMFGLPGQTEEDAYFDLQTAMQLNPTHISWYQLTLEPNTLFYQKPPTLPHDETIDAIFFTGKELLESEGYHQYEVSAYAKTGLNCQHNINYWKFGDYLGIGAGAHSKLTNIQQQKVTRFWKMKHPNDYLKAEKTFIAGEQLIIHDQIVFEFMLNALRLFEPISFQLFEENCGMPRYVLIEKLQKAQQKGLLIIDNEKFSTTELGKRFLNDLLTLFIND
ncbi:MAG: Heme chaperone HemW [Legionellaceae bacterium]